MRRAGWSRSIRSLRSRDCPLRIVVAARFADDQVEACCLVDGQVLRVTRKESKYTFCQLSHGLAHRGERGNRVGRMFRSVEAGDGDVVGHDEAEPMAGEQNAVRLLVG